MYKKENYRNYSDYFELVKKVTKEPTSSGMNQLLQSFNFSKKNRKTFKNYMTKYAPIEIAVPAILENINSKSPKEKCFLYVILVKLRYFDAICPLVKLAESELSDDVELRRFVSDTITNYLPNIKKQLMELLESNDYSVIVYVAPWTLSFSYDNTIELLEKICITSAHESVSRSEALLLLSGYAPTSTINLLKQYDFPLNDARRAIRNIFWV